MALSFWLPNYRQWRRYFRVTQLHLTTIPYELAISAIGVLVFAVMAAIKAQILYVGLSMFGLYLVYLAILVWKDSQLSKRESCSLLENHHLLDVEGPALSEFTCKESTVKHEGTIFERNCNDKPDEETIKYKEMYTSQQKNQPLRSGVNSMAEPHGSANDNGTLVRKEKSNNYPTTIKGVLDVIKRRTFTRSSGMVWVRKLIYLLELPVIFMM